MSGIDSGAGSEAEAAHDGGIGRSEPAYSPEVPTTSAPPVTDVAAAKDRAADASIQEDSDDQAREGPQGDSGLMLGLRLLTLLLAAGAAYYVYTQTQKGQFGGGRRYERPTDRPVIPPADVSASILLRATPEQAFRYAALPSTWPHWQRGCQQVSGEINGHIQVGQFVPAFAGDRYRAGFDLLPNATAVATAAAAAGEDEFLNEGDGRLVQWTVLHVREPQYSMDGDGSLHLQGYVLRQPDVRLELRFLWEPLTRQRRRDPLHSNFSLLLYLGGLDAAAKQAYRAQLQHSLRLLARQLAQPRGHKDL